VKGGTEKLSQNSKKILLNEKGGRIARSSEKYKFLQVSQREWRGFIPGGVESGNARQAWEGWSP